MGCDIHSFAEVKINNNWVKVSEHFSYFDTDSNYKSICKTDRVFYWRKYFMFAFLAGVKNYYNIYPLSKPKGIPKDSCPEIKLECDYWEHEGFSHSYLTLKELLDFDYTNKLSLYGNKSHTYMEHLGFRFFIHLTELIKLGEPNDVRVVFWFCN